MTIEGWLLFTLTEAVLCVSPGPAVFLVLSVSLTRGRSSGLLASAGILTANLLYFVLSATSLGAILLASWESFFFIKWVGAAYLIWLGIEAVCLNGGDGTAVPDGSAPSRSTRSGPATFLHGVVAQGANPKALLFFTALLPQFVNPAAPLAPQIALLAVTSVLIEFGVLAAYATLASRANGLARRPRFARMIQRVSGTLLIGAGVGLATLERR